MINAQQARLITDEAKEREDLLISIYLEIKSIAEQGLYSLAYPFSDKTTNGQKKWLIERLSNDGFEITDDHRELNWYKRD